jgi:ubiquinone/menaquinone biosynthesis C-methylase UbiE
MKKKVILGIKLMDSYLSAASCRLVYLTGKNKYPIHPKHLIPQKYWFEKYLNKNDLVLDLGSGIGQMSIAAARKSKKVIGLELDERSLEIARSNSTSLKIKNVIFTSQDLNKKLPFNDGYFNKIICSDVLEHLYKRDFALKEIKRVLKKGGTLFLVTDNPDNSWKRLQKSVGLFYYADPDHKYEYPREEILKNLNKLDFEVVSVEPVTYETPIKGWIDLTGGVSLSLYKRLRRWRDKMNKKYPEEAVGFRILAKLPERHFN